MGDPLRQNPRLFKSNEHDEPLARDRRDVFLILLAKKTAEVVPGRLENAILNEQLAEIACIKVSARFA